METFDDVEEGPDEDDLLETKSWPEMKQEPDDPETTLPSTAATGTEQSNQCQPSPAQREGGGGGVDATPCSFSGISFCLPVECHHFFL